MNWSKIAASVAGCVVCFCISGASAIEARKPLDGYVCMSFKHEQTYNDWIASGRVPKPPGGPDEPPVYKAPTEGSERIGYQTNLVITKWPLDKVNGFVPILLGAEGHSRLDRWNSDCPLSQSGKDIGQVYAAANGKWEY